MTASYRIALGYARRIEQLRERAHLGTLTGADRLDLAELLDEVEAVYGRAEREEIEAAIPAGVTACP